ncbi:MAG TPA: EAL domain-containing protein [Actinomycetota bacterium]|jgi:diguanylate cyclase (GGDEF)-like protein/PAS domain S-box-containing protein|nr:EAL domain-containing protein [Actinomycetota bacterium]
MEPQLTVEAVLRSVAFATERFLSDVAWRERIGEVLKEIGGAVAADRAYVFRNVRDTAGRLWMDLVSEWLADDVRPIFDDPDNHLHPYAPVFARWIEVLGEGGVIEGAVEELPEEDERRVLAREGVASVVAVPVFVGAEWWGFVGFDDCRDERTWSDVEIDALRSVAGAFGSALEREQAADRLRFAQEQYRSIVEHIPAITYIDDVNDQASTIYVSPQIESMLGYTAKEWIDDPDLWPKILHADDRARALAENARHNDTGEPFRLEYRLFAKDGRVIWVLDQAVIVRDDNGVPRYSHGVMMDISERKRAEEHVAFLAYHDKLTGLPNRAMFEELLELSLARARRHKGSVAVVCVDLDDFRLVNDSLGHHNGDELLRQVADRLRGATRETDLVARRGGDLFLLLLADLERDVSGEMDAAVIRTESVVQSIADSLRDPFVVDGTELYVSASMGISLFPQGASDATALLRDSEAAMYESKKAGPSSYVVSADAGDGSGGKLAFVTRLRKAVEAQRWVLHYQPVVQLAGGEMVGVEALIRWREPDGTIIPPNEFIPVAEDLGLIEEIGDWVVEEICRQDAIWRAEGLRLDIGFNLSPRQFWQPDLAERVLSRIAEGGMDPRRMIVEITESSAMLDPDRAQRILWELHAGGLRVAIDDFGTGYSSLSRLRDVPVEVLKVDRSFVDGVNGDPASASIVTAFIELARGLGMTTLAEGIETEEEWQFLRARGCQLGQGYLFSRPMPGDDILAYWRRGAIDPASAPVRSA